MLISSHAPTLFLPNVTDGITPYIIVPEAEELCFKIVMYP
jgi:hypothetical protein